MPNLIVFCLALLGVADGQSLANYWEIIHGLVEGGQPFNSVDALSANELVLMVAGRFDATPSGGCESFAALSIDKGRLGSWDCMVGNLMPLVGLRSIVNTTLNGICIAGTFGVTEETRNVACWSGEA